MTPATDPTQRLLKAAPAQEEIMGYALEWTTGISRIAVLLCGPRGARYGAMRVNDPDSDWCYLVDGYTGQNRQAKGNHWLQIPRGSQRITGAR